jgi:uncharacterized protein (TIRG00374 family)
VVSFAISAIFLYLALMGIEWSRVGRIFASARIRILLASLLLALIPPVLRASRWRVLLNAQGSISINTVFWANSAGYLGNTFLPGRAGELIRSMMISARSKLSTSYVFTTALTERAFDLVFLILAGSIALTTIPHKPVWLASAAGTLAVSGMVAATGLAIIPKTQRLAAWILERIPIRVGLRDRLLGIAGEVRLGVDALHQPARLFQFLILTVTIWAIDVLLTMLMAYVLDLSLSFVQALLLITALALSSAIPSSPGSVGVFQFVAVTVLGPFGFSKNDALAFILMTQALSYLITTLLGILALWKFNLSMSSFKAAAIGVPCN